jgi:hypothetical protein
MICQSDHLQTENESFVVAVIKFIENNLGHRGHQMRVVAVIK